MKCPVCSKEMVTENFGVSVDVCENGCKGIWFDQRKLVMLDEKNEGLGAALEAQVREHGSLDNREQPVAGRDLRHASQIVAIGRPGPAYRSEHRLPGVLVADRIFRAFVERH